MKFDSIEFVGRYGFPQIKGSSTKPTTLLPFNFAKTCKDKNRFVHFFIDDYQFERVWNKPNKYIPMLKQYKGVIGTDFSLYYDYPKALQIYNTYRNRWLDNFFIKSGIPVIPTVSWSDRESFTWCFDGIVKGSSVTLSTNGCHNKISKHIFECGYNKMIETINPEFIVCYGEPFDFMEKNNIIVFDNYLQKLRNMV